MIGNLTCLCKYSVKFLWQVATRFFTQVDGLTHHRPLLVLVAKTEIRSSNAFGALFYTSTTTTASFPYPFSLFLFHWDFAFSFRIQLANFVLLLASGHYPLRCKVKDATKSMQRRGACTGGQPPRHR